MKSGRSVILFLLLCGLAHIYAEGPLVMFSAGDGIFEDLAFLSAESGVSVTSFTPPLSSDEIALFLDRIDTGALSGRALHVYQRVQERLSPALFFPDEFIRVSFGGEISVEGRVRTSTDIDWHSVDTQRPGLIKADAALYLGGFAQLAFSPAVQPFPDAAAHDGYAGTNVPYTLGIDFGRAPQRAFAAVGGSYGNGGWSLQFGRDRLSFGGAHTGNLLISDTPDFYDFFRASAFSRRIKYSFLVSHIPLSLDTKSGNFIDPGYWPGSGGDDPLARSVDRYLYVHRFDIKPLDVLSVAFTEAMVAGNAPLRLRYLSPLLIMHNLFSGYESDAWAGNDGLMDNMLFSIEVTWNIFPSLSVYAQWLVDDLKIPFVDPDVNQKPDACAWLAGVNFSHSFDEWALLCFAEAVYADPYLYVENSPFGSLVWYHYMTAHPYSSSRYTWIGHPEGRDFFMFSTGARLWRDRLAVNARISYVIHGEHGLYWDWEAGERAWGERAPSGTPEHRISAAASVNWEFTPHFSLSGSIGGAVLVNANTAEAGSYRRRHSDETFAGLEITAGLTWKW